MARVSDEQPGGWARPGEEQAPPAWTPPQGWAPQQPPPYVPPGSSRTSAPGSSPTSRPGSRPAARRGQPQAAGARRPARSGHRRRRRSPASSRCARWASARSWTAPSRRSARYPRMMLGLSRGGGRRSPRCSPCRSPGCCCATPATRPSASTSRRRHDARGGRHLRGQRDHRDGRPGRRHPGRVPGAHRHPHRGVSRAVLGQSSAPGTRGTQARPRVPALLGVTGAGRC